MTKGIEYRGPFFERDPRKTFERNVAEFMADVAREGERMVVEQTGMAGREGAAVRPYIRGRTRSLAGKPWKVTAVVSVTTGGLDKAGAIRIKAIGAGRKQSVTKAGRLIGTTRGFEGRTHAFRKVRNAIRRALRADRLTKGWGS